MYADWKPCGRLTQSLIAEVESKMLGEILWGEADSFCCRRLQCHPSMQSCQPLHFGRSLLCWGHRTTLMIISLRSPPQKTKIVYFWSRAGSNVPATGCACAFFISVMLVVSQPVGAYVLNQPINRSLRFSSRSYASLPGETTSVFSCFKSPCQCKMLKASSRVINLIKKIHIKLFWEEYICTFLSPMTECTMLNDRSTGSVTSTNEKQ